MPTAAPSPPKLMRVGQVLPAASYYGAVPLYADLVRQSSDWTGPCTLDADGWPLSTGPGGISCIVTQPPSNEIDDAGLPNAPWGTYTVTWEGAGSCHLGSVQGDAVTGPPAGSPGPAAFAFAPSSSSRSAPAIALFATGACANIRVWPPGVPADGTAPKFYPGFLAQLEGMDSIRTETFVPVNPGMVVDYADFPRTSYRTVAGTTGSSTVPIASMAPAPAGETYGFFGTGRGIVVTTTAVPHGLKTGHTPAFSVPAGAVATDASGTTWSLFGYQAVCHAIDATSFATAIPDGTGVTSVASVTLGGPGTVTRQCNGAPPEDAVDLANALPGCDLHLNVPHAMSDAGVAALAAMVAGRLAPGRPWICELSNEPWNTGWPYLQSGYFSFLGIQRGHGLDGIQQYVQRASEVWALARAAFIAAGRPADQVIRVLNVQILDSFVDAYCAYAANPTDPAAGGARIAFDRLMVAPYVHDGVPYSADPANNALTLDQVMDDAEATIPGTIGAAHDMVRAHLDRGGFPEVAIMDYEWGPSTLFAGGDLAHLATQSQGANLHPRNYALTTAMLAESQASGSVLATKQSHSSDMTSDTQVKGACCYGTYFGCGMLPGIGDGSDGLADNRPALAAMVAGGRAPDYAAMASPPGGALRDWALAARAARASYAPATAAFVATDATTQGNWRGAYGADGYAIAGGASSLPAYATLALAGATPYQWPAPGTTDVRALADAADAGRVAPAWYAPLSFTATVAIADGQPHRLAAYFLDWDGWGPRHVLVAVRDADTGALLHAIDPGDMTEGKYLAWDVTGTIEVRVTNLNTNSRGNAILAALFLDPPGAAAAPAPPAAVPAPQPVVTPQPSALPPAATSPLVVPVPGPTPTPAPTPAAPSDEDRLSALEGAVALLTGRVGALEAKAAPAAIPAAAASVPAPAPAPAPAPPPAPASATFLGTDGTTQGTWPNHYGRDGHWLPGDPIAPGASAPSTLPGYATATATGTAFAWTDGIATADVRAPQTSDLKGRRAVCWYDARTFDIAVTIADGQPHRASLYLLNWDGAVYGARSERVDVIDAASGAVLDTRTPADFVAGTWLSWKVAGAVTFRVTNLEATDPQGRTAVVSGLFLDPPPAAPGGTATSLAVPAAVPVAGK